MDEYASITSIIIYLFIYLFYKYSPLLFSKHHHPHLQFYSLPHVLFLPLPSMTNFSNDIFVFAVFLLILKKLFSGIRLSVSDFHCETCELAKHCCSSYSSCMSSGTTPFFLFYFYVWGPIQSPLCLAYVTLWPLLMITLGLLRFTCWNPRMRFFLAF